MDEVRIVHKAGTNLVENVQPLFRSLYFSQVGLACHHCLRKGACLKRCMGCKVFSYCDRKCQEEDWKVAHKTECKIQQHIQGIIPDTHMNMINFVIRLFGFMGAQPENAAQLRELFPGKTGALDQIGDVGSAASQCIPAAELDSLKVLSAAFAAIKCLFGPPEENWNKVLHFAGLVKLYISSYWYYSPPRPGDGFFPHYLLLKHSCRPNAVLHLGIDEVSLRAIKDIKQGEDVTVNRMRNDFLLELEHRNRHISRQLIGPCCCQRCEQERSWNVPGADGHMMKFAEIRNVYPDPGLFNQYTELKMQEFKWKVSEFDPAITLYLYSALIIVSERLSKQEFDDGFHKVIEHARVSVGIEHPQFQSIMQTLSSMYNNYT